MYTQIKYIVSQSVYIKYVYNLKNKLLNGIWSTDTRNRVPYKCRARACIPVYRAPHMASWSVVCRWMLVSGVRNRRRMRHIQRITHATPPQPGGVRMWPPRLPAKSQLTWTLAVISFYMARGRGALRRNECRPSTVVGPSPWWTTGFSFPRGFFFFLYTIYGHAEQ